MRTTVSPTWCNRRKSPNGSGKSHCTPLPTPFGGKSLRMSNPWMVKILRKKATCRKIADRKSKAVTNDSKPKCRTTGWRKGFSCLGIPESNFNRLKLPCASSRSCNRFWEAARQNQAAKGPERRAEAVQNSARIGSVLASVKGSATVRVEGQLQLE